MGEGGRVHIRVHGHRETSRVPLEPWRAHVGLVRQEQTRRRAREGGDTPTSLCRRPWFEP